MGQTKMRITKPPITQDLKDILDLLADERILVSGDTTLTKHFVYDVYSLFATPDDEKRASFKTYWDLFMDIKGLYVILKVQGLRRTIKFYNDIKDFLYMFYTTRVFRKLNNLEPLEATKIFLDMFRSRQQKPTPSLDSLPQPQEVDEESEEGESEEEANTTTKSPPVKQTVTNSEFDQDGMSAETQNLPIDMGEFQSRIGIYEDMIDAGFLDDVEIRRMIAREAGVSIRDITLSNFRQLIDDVGDKLDKSISIFNVARKHELVDVYRKSVDIDDSPTPDNDMTIETNKSVSDIVRALPMEFLYDDDVFTKKVIEHSLNITQYQTQRLRRQVLYLLLDVSGSMQELNNRLSMYACGIAVSLIRQAIREGSTYFLRYFDGGVKNLIKITNKEEANSAIEELLHLPFSGGGTNFDCAIGTAIQDIKGDTHKFENADIMIITDGQDSCSITSEELDFIKLHAVLVGNGDGSTGTLKKISESFVKVTDKEIKDMINGVE